MSEVGGSSPRVQEKPDPGPCTGPASCGGAVVLLLATTTADWRPFTRVWWCAAQHRYIIAAFYIILLHKLHYHIIPYCGLTYLFIYILYTLYA